KARVQGIGATLPCRLRCLTPLPASLRLMLLELSECRVNLRLRVVAGYCPDFRDLRSAQLAQELALYVGVNPIRPDACRRVAPVATGMCIALVEITDAGALTGRLGQVHAATTLL